MLSLDEALERVLAAAVPLPAELVAVERAYGRVLAEDVTAPEDLPAFDYSAMDGYALASAELEGDGPFTLPVRHESRAGQGAPALEPRSACRIFTGAPLPDGADTVIIQELVTREGGAVSFSRRPSPGDNVRRRGEDLRRGGVALCRGRRLGAFELGLASAMDRSELSVFRRPRVAILSTGDELRDPGAPGPFGSIPDSNGAVVSALSHVAGASVSARERVGDERELLAATLERMAEASDVLVTIGGASVGDHDLLQLGLADVGAEVSFWKVRIKPGKPLLFGKLGRTHVLGLPGNPVSAQLTFVLFGMPLLRTLQGDRLARPERVSVRLGAPIRQKPGRLGLYRAKLAAGVALPQQNQASGSSLSLADADVVVLVPDDCEGLDEGSLVEAIALPRP